MNSPKIKEITVSNELELLILFENKIKKKYNCKPLLVYPQFKLLENDAFFKTVKVDPGGYGISWNSEIDLSEYELWSNGKEIY